MGVPPHLVRWMAAFLIDRQQSVKIGDTVSNIGYPNGGVPQGTLSGPKNFLVQINDLQTPCPIFKYVDDSTVFDVCNNTSVPMLQESADVITDWSRRNDMRINARKTKEMIICFCRNDNHVASIPRIVLDDNDIERVTQAKVLGVTLSSDLSWNAHVDTIVRKARNRVFTIYQLKRAGIRQCDLLRVYVSVIRPVLEYACRYGIRVFQCIYQTILKLFKRGVFEQYFLGTVTTRQDQSPICQLSLKGAPNCASRIFGKCKTLITSYTNYYQSSAAFHTV